MSAIDDSLHSDDKKIIPVTQEKKIKKGTLPGA